MPAPEVPRPLETVLALPFRRGGPWSWGHGLAQALAPEAGVRLADSPLAMRRLLGRHDLVHTAVPFVHSRGPLLATIHGDFRLESLRYRGAYERLLQRADACTVPSRFLRERLDLPGATVLPNGVSDPGMRWRPPADGATDAPLRVLVASKFDFLAKTQGTLDAIAALARMQTRLPLKVAVAGAGKMEGQVRQAAQRAGFEVLGWQSDLPRLFSGHDVLVYRSYLDNQPMLLIEAMLSGIPIVANRVGDTPDLLPPEALADDDAELESRLEALAHPQAREHLSRELRRRGESYLWPRLKPRWLALYEGLLA
jgi:glycosyltransferase involved in cell wall biosynthesis